MWGRAGRQVMSGGEDDEGLVRVRAVTEFVAASVLVIWSITGTPHIGEAAEGERLRPVSGRRVDRRGEMARCRGNVCWAKCTKGNGRARRRVGMPVRGAGVEREPQVLKRRGGAWQRRWR